jgi:serine/threonine-protein kinase RsbW
MEKVITYTKIMNDISNDFWDGLVTDNNTDSADWKRPITHFNFKIKSSTDQITRMVQKFDQLIENHNYCSLRTKSELSTALSEALANAIIHGNEINPDKFVDLKIQIYKDRMILRIKDKGTGFNYKELPNPLTPENIKKTSGRGIYLMSVLVDKVEFIRHKDGMEVILIKYLPERNRYRN